MRLTCPSCAAIYEVEDIAIPASGRRVRCSACDAGWRVAGDGAAVVRNRARLAAVAARASAAFEEERTAQRDAPAEAAPVAEPRPAPDEAPQSEAKPPQPKKPEPTPVDVAVARSTPEAKRPEMPASNPPDAPASQEPGARAAKPPDGAPSAEREDGEFRTFKPIRMRPAPVIKDDDEDEDEDEERSSPLRSILGFFVGFALVLILFAPYLFRDQIISAAPSLAPFVDGYADTIRWVQNGVRGAYEGIAEEVRYLVNSPPPDTPAQ